jgi:hypothetical protein
LNAEKLTPKRGCGAAEMGDETGDANSPSPGARCRMGRMGERAGEAAMGERGDACPADAPEAALLAAASYSVNRLAAAIASDMRRKDSVGGVEDMSASVSVSVSVSTSRADESDGSSARATSWSCGGAGAGSPGETAGVMLIGETSMVVCW